MRIAWLVVLVACTSKGSSEGFTPAGQCNVDSDCVISCDTRGDCCNSPFCENVQHKDTAAANAAFNAKECTPEKRQHCPVVGGRETPNYRIVPTCKAGSCVGVREPLPGAATAAPDASSPAQLPPGGSEVVDTRGYVKTCKTKADCKIVKDDPCNHCSCADKAIAATEIARFEAAATAIKCGPREPIHCGECRGFFADCLDGQCIAKPE